MGSYELGISKLTVLPFVQTLKDRERTINAAWEARGMPEWGRKNKPFRTFLLLMENKQALPAFGGSQEPCGWNYYLVIKRFCLFHTQDTKLHKTRQSEPARPRWTRAGSFWTSGHNPTAHCHETRAGGIRLQVLTPPSRISYFWKLF